VSEPVAGALAAMGHEFTTGGRQGSVQALLVERGTDARVGAPDRRDGDAAAAGY
jgi:gamma-glutamyltranspeptidase